MTVRELESAGAMRDRMSPAREVIHLEAAYLDERQWQDWLALFTEDCEYWMPAWVSDDVLAGDPQTELSHIYYSSRAALEDRIIRIKSKLSPASTPLPRTTHILGLVRPLEAASPDRTTFVTPWTSHVFWPTTGDKASFFGRYEHSLVFVDGKWLIERKKIILQNDYIPSVVDIYCL